LYPTLLAFPPATTTEYFPDAENKEKNRKFLDFIYLDLHLLEFENKELVTSWEGSLCSLSFKFGTVAPLRRRNTRYKNPQLVVQHCFVASFGRCFPFFTLHDQLDPQQKHLLQVEEMQHSDWLICQTRANLLRAKLRV